MTYSTPLIFQFPMANEKAMSEVVLSLSIFVCKHLHSKIIIFAGSAAMEAAACNMVEPNDVVLVCVNGLWGARWGDMAERAGKGISATL